MKAQLRRCRPVHLRIDHYPHTFRAYQRARWVMWLRCAPLLILVLSGVTGCGVGAHGVTATPTATASPVATAPTRQPTFAEFHVPVFGNIDSMVAGADGNIWFTQGYAGSDIGRITPTGAITMFHIPTNNNGTQFIANGSDGALWFSELTANKVGRITPSGTITEYPVPATGGPGVLVAGQDGALWFAESGEIDRITPSGSIRRFALPSGVDGANSLAVGADGAIWFTVTGSATCYVGRVAPSGAVTLYPLSQPNSSPQSILKGPDGAIWFVESSGPGKIGRITPNGNLAEFPIPTADGQPYALQLGPDGALWFVSSTLGSSPTYTIGRITTTGAVTNLAYPSSMPGAIVRGPDGNGWFGADRQLIRVTSSGLLSPFDVPNITSPIGPIITDADGRLWLAAGVENTIIRVTP